MLPQRQEIASVVVCEDDAADPRAALRPPRRRPLRRPAGAQRLRRAAALPLQPARPAAARPRRCPTPPGSTCCARSARPTGSTLALRPEPAGDRPHRPRRRRRPRARPRVRRRRLPGQAVPLPGAAGADRRGAAARRGRAARGRCRVGEIVVDPARRKVWVGEREVRALQQGVLAAARPRLRSAPGLLQAGAARGRSGATAARRGRGRSTRTRAGCGANSTRSTAAT